MDLFAVQTKQSPALRILVAALLSAVLFFAGSMAWGSAGADAKVTQPNCKKIAKKMKKATGKKKARLKSQLKRCKKNRKVYNQVKDSRFVGARGDGEPVDIILCANGKFGDDVGTASEQVYRKGWKIEGARVRGKFFQAGFAAKVAGGERVGAIKKSKSGWQVGISSFDGTQLTEFGPVKKSDASKICRSL